MSKNEINYYIIGKMDSTLIGPMDITEFNDKKKALNVRLAFEP